MPRFRRKSNVTEAVEFDPANVHRLQLPDGVEGVAAAGADNWGYEGCEFFVMTAHGQRTKVVQGDWIVPEPDGRGFYPVKHDIFAATYEPADIRSGPMADEVPTSGGVVLGDMRIFGATPPR